MTEVEAPRAQTGRPTKGLDREVVVRAALRAIDLRGPHNLTMRGLGQDLGVEAMSLYRYVSGREDLLEAVVALLLDNFRRDLDAAIDATWQGYLQNLAHAVRRIAVEHPAAFPLVATRHPAAPVAASAAAQPRARGAVPVHPARATASATSRPSARTAPSPASCSASCCSSRRPAARRRDPWRPRWTRAAPASPRPTPRPTPADNPTVVRLRPLLSEDRSDEEFEIGLETLLDRLEMALAQ